MNETTWVRRDCVSAEVENQLVLLDLDKLAYHALNETAAQAWELLVEPRSAEQLTVAMCERYEIEPDACRGSIDRLLQNFSEAGLIQPKAA